MTAWDKALGAEDERMTLCRMMLRRNARAVLVAGLLVGVAAGVGLWSMAAARRTRTSVAAALQPE